MRNPARRKTLFERLFRRFMFKYYAKSLYLDLQLVAKKQSVEYVLAHMQDSVMCEDRWGLLKYAFELAPADGLLLEFGVADASSINHVAGFTDRPLAGFDSFEGLPEAWSGTFEKRGAFSQGGRLPKVRDNVRLLKGWFDETLPGFLAATPGPVAFLHIDCDLYSSTKTVLDLLADRIVPGTVIVFDEYFNYSGWQRHEYKAFQEFVANGKRRYEYVGYAGVNGHVAVRIVA